MNGKFTFILAGFGAVILFFVVLKSRASNVLNIGNITSVNGDFSNDFTNLGSIRTTIRGTTAGPLGTVNPAGSDTSGNLSASASPCEKITRGGIPFLKCTTKTGIVTYWPA